MCSSDLSAMTHRTPFNRTPLEWSALGHIAVAALIVGGGLVLSATCAAAEASTAAAGAASIPDLIQSRDTNPVLPVDGTYLVDEDVSFVVDHEGGETLLRFAGDDEIFTLSVEHAPLGGRVLKYDTGDLAMAVSSWGGVTIYTATVPSGTPADRVGEGAKLTPTPPSIQDMRKLASAWAQRLQHDLALATHFDADWETQQIGRAHV